MGTKNKPLKDSKLLFLLLGLFVLVLICVFSISSFKPVYVINENQIGEQFNAWNNTLSGANGYSNIIDTKNFPHISIMTSTSGNTDLSVYVSEDSINFILCEDLTTKINNVTGYTSHIFFTAGARYYQLQSSNNVIINATIVGKR